MYHHPFSPSRLEQIRLCPGSWLMQQGLPEHESEYAKEGQLLHEAVALGKLDGLNSEQKGLVEKSLSFLDEIDATHDVISLHHEEHVQIKETDSLLTEGTADVITENRDDTICVIDWKFGWNPVNDVSSNIQLAAYAVGAMQKFGKSSCTCYVYQPRLKKKSSYVFSNPQAIIQNIQTLIFMASCDSVMLLRPSEDACRYCRARLNCPAFRVKFQKLAAAKADYDLDNPNTLSELYGASRSVKSVISEIESKLKSVIEKNGSCGNWIIETTEGSRKINDLNALFDKLKDLVTPREFNSVCSVTMGKMETLVSDKLVTAARARGEKLSREAARRQLADMIDGLVTRGTPSKKIVEKVG